MGIFTNRKRVSDDETAAPDSPRPPHCDPAILHAPGKCKYCDECKTFQSYRMLAGIAFTGEWNEMGMREDPNTAPAIAPCPSTWSRSPQVRDKWLNNRPWPKEEG